MTSARIRNVFLIVVGLALLSGCGGGGPRLAELGPDALYTSGIAAYEEGDYERAIELLEAFAQQHLGDPRVPEARLTLGRAHMARREYITAASAFQRLVTDFPASPLAPEARFGICEAYTRLSPQPPLDQEYTHAAIAHCQSVATLYPETEEGREASEQVEELRERLARKIYQIGMFYFQRGAYDAGVIYFEDVVNLYPGTNQAPAALLRIVESYERIGYVEEAAEARERLIREYPDSPEAQGPRA